MPKPRQIVYKVSFYLDELLHEISLFVNVNNNINSHKHNQSQFRHM